MGKQLIANEEYILPPRNLHYKRGEVFEADDNLYLFLMADAPGVFAVYAEPESKAMTEPPANKMMSAPKAKK